MKHVTYYTYSLILLCVINNSAFTMPQDAGMGEEYYYEEEVPAGASFDTGIAPADFSAPITAAPADQNAQSIQMPAPPAEGATLTPTPEVVAEPLTGPDVLQISEGKPGLMPSGDAQVEKIFEDSEKQTIERQNLIKSMKQTAKALRDKFTEQDAKLDTFYQASGFDEGQVKELFSPIKTQN